MIFKTLMTRSNIGLQQANHDLDDPTAAGRSQQPGFADRCSLDQNSSEQLASFP